MAILRAKAGVVDFEFLNCTDRGLEHDRAEKLVDERNPVDHVVDGVIAVAGGVEPESTQTTGRG